MIKSIFKLVLILLLLLILIGMISQVAPQTPKWILKVIYHGILFYAAMIVYFQYDKRKK